MMVKKLYQIWVDGGLWVANHRFFYFLLKVYLAFGSIQTTTAAFKLHVDLEAVVRVATSLL